MSLSPLGRTDLHVHDLCLGGNVFGWSANESQSFGVLDAYATAGGNFIDTADMYSSWHDGNVGGESETIIGNWMKSHGNRQDIVVATKVAKLETRPGLSAANIVAAAEDSLRRLQTDYIDIYYAHHDDEETPLEESLVAFDQLVQSGKVRHLGASNYTAPRLAEALRISRDMGLAEYVVVQPNFNAITRDEYQGELQDLCVKEKLAVLPYFSLAAGFLTGKYAPGVAVESVRAEDMDGYATERGWAIVDKVRNIANSHNVDMSTIALEWLRTQPGIASPIASARTVEQLVPLMARVTLSESEVAELNAL